jgi:plastocyanin
MRLLAALAALVLAAGLAACGDDDDDDGGGGAAAGTLEITEFQFSDVSAPAGGTLEVVNSSGGGHTVTADDGEFDEEVADGETVEVPVPAEPGEYPFHCEIHPNMRATLTAE